MPESRNRPGHPVRKPSDIPASQRTTGHFLWSVLVGIFAFIIAWFSFGWNVPAIIACTVAGLLIGYLAGRRMEKDVKS